jgi:AraC-like DNA-binding protein
VRFRGDALLSESEVDRQARARLQFLRRRAYVGRNRLDLKPVTTRRMKDLFARAVAEDSERESGYRCLLKGIALEMIVLVARDVGFKWDDRRETGNRMLDVLETLENDPTQRVTVEEMAKRARLSRSQFHAAFKRIAGTTLLDHVTRLKVNVARRLLTGSRMEIMDVCFESGFESVSRFYDVFKRYTGLAPGDYRKRMGHEV